MRSILADHARYEALSGHMWPVERRVIGDVSWFSLTWMDKGGGIFDLVHTKASLLESTRCAQSL